VFIPNEANAGDPLSALFQDESIKILKIEPGARFRSEGNGVLKRFRIGRFAHSAHRNSVLNAGRSLIQSCPM
jgi:hypothetical protein